MSKKVGPLEELIKRLRLIGIPSLSALITKFGNVEEYQEFVMLIREYVPEYEAEILRETTESAQVVSFASHFEDRYFPLAWWIRDHAFDDAGYRELLDHLPVEVMGWTYEEYDEISSRADVGLQLMAYLVEHPYDEENMVSLAEACQEHVPRDTLQRMPQGGIKSDIVHPLFDNTKFKPIAMLVDWFNSDTGNFFLDTDEEFLSYNMGWPEWSSERVEELTRHWREMEVYRQEIWDFAEWLEGSPEERFQEILDYLEEKEVISKKCKECGGKMTYTLTATDLMKQTWEIYKCSDCGFEERLEKGGD